MKIGDSIEIVGWGEWKVESGTWEFTHDVTYMTLGLRKTTKVAVEESGEPPSITAAKKRLGWAQEASKKQWEKRTFPYRYETGQHTSEVRKGIAKLKEREYFQGGQHTSEEWGIRDVRSTD